MIELLVVITIIALLIALLLPVMEMARGRAYQIQCASQMRQYGIALVSYGVENEEQFPWYSRVFDPIDNTNILETHWYNALAPFVGGIRIQPGDSSVAQKDSQNWNQPVHKCPTGEAFIGPHYGGINRPRRFLGLSDYPKLAPFLYGEDWRGGPGIIAPSVRHDDIQDPATWIALLDVKDWGMYSPNGWNFNTDLDKDGVDDSNFAVGDIYNFARPKVHLNGSNILLCDGHVEPMSFSVFLDIDNGLWWDGPHERFFH